MGAKAEEPVFIKCRCWGEVCSPDEGAKPQPSTAINLTPMGPGTLSSAGAGVCTKAPAAFPDSNSVLDKFQSAIRHLIAH